MKDTIGIETKPDWPRILHLRLFWSALLGLIGIPIEGLCYFGIYRLMAEAAPGHAHAYRVGILGYMPLIRRRPWRNA